MRRDGHDGRHIEYRHRRSRVSEVCNTTGEAICSDFPTGKGAVLGPFSSWGRNVETDAAGTTPVLRLEPTPDGRPAAPPAVRPIAVHQHAASAAAVSITV